MSADNYAICPKCSDQSKNKLKSSYGKVTEVEYVALLRNRDTMEDDERTLREDWELGMDKHGLFYVSYSCSCSVCHFSYEYKDDKQVYNPKEIE